MQDKRQPQNGRRYGPSTTASALHVRADADRQDDRLRVERSVRGRQQIVDGPHKCEAAHWRAALGRALWWMRDGRRRHIADPAAGHGGSGCRRRGSSGRFHVAAPMQSRGPAGHDTIGRSVMMKSPPAPQRTQLLPPTDSSPLKSSHPHRSCTP